jgi:hypothetical protein
MPRPLLAPFFLSRWSLANHKVPGALPMGDSSVPVCTISA